MMKALFQGSVNRTIGSLNKQLAVFEREERGKRQQCCDKIGEAIERIHSFIFGDIGKPPDADKKKEALSKLIQSQLFLSLIRIIPMLGSNASKKQICDLLAYQLREPTIIHSIRSLRDRDGHNEVIQALIDHYDEQNCAALLYAITREPQLLPLCYGEQPRDVVDALIRKMQSPDLVVCTSANKALRRLLTAKTAATRLYLAKHSRRLFKLFYDILSAPHQKENGLLAKKLLILLQDIVTSRRNWDLLQMLLIDEQYLLLTMRLMKRFQTKSPAVSIEAFCVFRLFVANPNKTSEVQRALYKYKHRLVKLLVGYQFTAKPGKSNDCNTLLRGERDEIVEILKAYHRG